MTDDQRESERFGQSRSRDKRLLTQRLVIETSDIVSMLTSWMSDLVRREPEPITKARYAELHAQAGRAVIDACDNAGRSAERDADALLARTRRAQGDGEDKRRARAQGDGDDGAEG
jgi:hypothetical protein